MLLSDRKFWFILEVTCHIVHTKTQESWHNYFFQCLTSMYILLVSLLLLWNPLDSYMKNINCRYMIYQLTPLSAISFKHNHLLWLWCNHLSIFHHFPSHTSIMHISKLKLYLCLLLQTIYLPLYLYMYLITDSTDFHYSLHSSPISHDASPTPLALPSHPASPYPNPTSPHVSDFSYVPPYVPHL